VGGIFFDIENVRNDLTEMLRAGSRGSCGSPSRSARRSATLPKELAFWRRALCRRTTSDVVRRSGRRLGAKWPVG